MTAQLMLYGLVLTALLGASAWFLERALRTWRRPGRWVWVPAMAAGALGPLLARLLPGASPGEPGRAGASLSLEQLYALLPQGPSGAQGADFLPAALADPLRLVLADPLLTLWVAATALTLTLFLAASLHLRHQTRRWPRQKVEEEEVLLSPETGPALVGLLRPRIVLPAWTLALPVRELRMVLLHEGEHRRAGDPALLGLGILLVSLAPWNPGLWWMLFRLRLAVEGDCDGRVLARGVPRKPYGRLLLEVATGTRRPFPLAAMLAEGNRGSLERRLRMMRRDVRKHRWTAALAAVLAGGFFLALACEAPTPPGVDEDTEWTVNKVDYPLAAEEVTLESDTGSLPHGMKAGRALLTPDTSTLEGGVRVVVDAADGMAEKGAGTAAPLVFIDDEPVGRMTSLDSLNALNIKRIEIIKGAAAREIYGDEAANGVIKIYLKK